MGQRNRGKHPSDEKLFSLKWLPVFKEAVDDLCHLLSRGYAPNSSIEIVGNRYKLNKRQRSAVLRISSSEQEIIGRQQNHCAIEDLENKIIQIDGFNLLILLESALSGAYVFKSRDGTYRDISSVHGSYKRVLQTEKAIELVGEVLAQLKVKSVHWYLDQPISNSGRLKSRLLEFSVKQQYNWQVDLVYNPDKLLAESEHVVVSSDGWILDRAKEWFNLGAYLIDNHIPATNLLIC